MKKKVSATIAQVFAENGGVVNGGYSDGAFCITAEIARQVIGARFAELPAAIKAAKKAVATCENLRRLQVASRYIDFWDNGYGSDYKLFARWDDCDVQGKLHVYKKPRYVQPYLD